MTTRTEPENYVGRHRQDDFVGRRALPHYSTQAVVRVAIKIREQLARRSS